MNIRYETGNSAVIIPFRGKLPKIHPTAFLTDGVKIIGDVEIGEQVSVWFNSVIRGDVNYIRIGDRSNIQDLAMLHVTNKKWPLILEEDVSVAHSVTLHGAVIKKGALIGIGAIVLDGATVGEYALVGAGAVVREGFTVPPRTLVAGVPAKVIRELSDEELERVSTTPQNYIGYTAEYMKELENYRKTF